MQCPICRDSNATWKNVDAFRMKEEGMCMCDGCGFVSYPDKYKTKAEIIDYYKKEYRQPPNVGNIYSGERKIQYHAHFLNDLFEKWRNDKRTGIQVADIGSAFGLFLNWVRHQLPGSQVEGVELTTSFVRNAWHLFQVKTIPEFDTTKKYDLISSYKSLEHILDPDIELKSYIDALKDDGYLYLGVPIWFEQMKNFGAGGFDIEYYYSTNHINAWTRKHVEGLIRVCGGEVVKQNHTFYDSVYLVKRNVELVTTDRSSLKEDPATILERLKKIQEANEHFQLGAYDKAIETWPNFPSAWFNHYEHNRKKYHGLGFEGIYNDFCKKSLEACQQDADLHYFTADICARYDQYEKAIEHLNIANKLRPNMPNVFALLHNCFASMAKSAADEESKTKFFEQARQCAKILGEVSTESKAEAMTWMMYDNAQIPTPFEVQ